MPSSHTARIAAAALSFAAALPALAQSSEVTIDLSGIQIRGPFNDQVRSSASNPAPGSDTIILPAEGYQYTVDGTVDVNLLGGLISFSGPADTLFNLLNPGADGLLDGYIRYKEGILPPAGDSIVWIEQFGGDFLGAQIEVTLEIKLDSAGVVTFRLGDIDIDPLFALFFNVQFPTGTARLATWAPPEPQFNEWHLDGDLTAADGADDGQIRYLDDPAFGPILGGIGNETGLPGSPTPTGITEAQSSFVDTSASPIPAPGGIDDTVYLSSPNANAADPGNSTLRRGIGLSVFPSAQPAYPGIAIGQWTAVWDLYIPASSWFADFPTNTQPNEFLAALIQDNHNNDSGADLWLRNQGGQTVLVYSTDGDDFGSSALPVTLPAAVAPDTWFRLALVSNEFRDGSGRVYVNGQFVGTGKGDWLYNNTDPTNPTYADDEALPTGTWDAWGQFPSPWSTSSGVLNPDLDGNPTPTPMASAFGLFADLRFTNSSKPVYLANFAFVDDLLTDQDIADLGGPTGDGIFFLKSVGQGCNPADVAEDFGVLNIDDVLSFLNLFAVQDPIADIDPNGSFDIDDVLAFLNEFANGCP